MTNEEIIYLCEHPNLGWNYIDRLREVIKQLMEERDIKKEGMKK